jgi:hypothetical protein
MTERTHRLCGLGTQQLIDRKPCYTGHLLQQGHRWKVFSSDDVANGRLAYTNAPRKVCLRRARAFKVFVECSHMTESIGNPYNFAIGRSYSEFVQTWGMAKNKQRTVLERALEALSEKYPRERASQVRLAHLAGVKQPTVNEWGELNHYPSMGTAVRLAEQLDVCVEWLLTERGPKYAQKALKADEQLIPLISEWANLKEDQKRQIARYADFIKSEAKT